MIGNTIGTVRARPAFHLAVRYGVPYVISMLF